MLGWPGPAPPPVLTAAYHNTAAPLATQEQRHIHAKRTSALSLRLTFSSCTFCSLRFWDLLSFLAGRPSSCCVLSSFAAGMDRGCSTRAFVSSAALHQTGPHAHRLKLHSQSTSASGSSALFMNCCNTVGHNFRHQRSSHLAASISRPSLPAMLWPPLFTSFFCFRSRLLLITDLSNKCL